MLVLLLLRKIVYLSTLSHRNGHLWDGHCPSEKFDPFMQSQWKKCGRILPRWHSGGPKYPSQIFLLSRLNLLKKNYPGEIQFDQIISVNCPSGKYCCNNRPSRFFFLWTCPSRFFCPKSVPVNFTGQILSQSNYPAQNLIPVDINLVLVKNDLK